MKHEPSAYISIPLVTVGTTNPDEAIKAFARRLAGQQQPLGEPFSKILYENLWDLYDQ